MKFGPQNEPLLETAAEWRMTAAELRTARAKHERDVAVDGPGFIIPAKKVPDSSLTSGTDRAQELEFARGPQGELLFPSLDAVCPTCGQPFAESASQPGADLSPEAPVYTDDITELSA
jgi:hypothetical protein